MRAGLPIVAAEVGGLAEALDGAGRLALVDAIDQVGTWDSLALLTTHGHADHVGNNDLADRLVANRDVTVRRLVRCRDLAQMRDPVSYWTTYLERVAGVLPIPIPPHRALRAFSPSSHHSQRWRRRPGSLRRRRSRRFALARFA
jgi:glyoxylase-like metal-dependent hydrolase (beta-lactamase superfamily II)